MPGGAAPVSRADRLRHDYVDNKVNDAAAHAHDMPEQGTDHLGNINLGLGFLSDAAGITAGALGMDNGIHQGKNGLSESDGYMKGRSTGAGWLNIGAGIANLGQSGISMFQHGRKLYNLRNNRDSIKKTESKWGMASAVTRGAGSIFKIASGAMGVAGVTDPTQTGFVAGTGAVLNTAASVFDTIGAGKTASEYGRRSKNARALMYGADKQADYDAYKRNSKNQALRQAVRNSYAKEAKGVKAKMYAMRQAEALNRIKGNNAHNRAVTSGVAGITGGLVSLGGVLAKSLIGGAAGSILGGVAGMTASAISTVNKGFGIANKKQEKNDMDKFHKDVVEEYLNKKADKIIAQYDADRLAEANAAAQQPDRQDDEDEENDGENDEQRRRRDADESRSASSGGSSTTGSSRSGSSGSSGTVSTQSSDSSGTVVSQPPVPHPPAQPRAGAALDKLTRQEAYMIALARLGVYNGPIDDTAQFDVTQYYGHAFNAITKKRASLIMNSKDEDRAQMIEALGLKPDATEAEVASALGYEG